MYFVKTLRGKNYKTMMFFKPPYPQLKIIIVEFWKKCTPYSALHESYYNVLQACTERCYVEDVNIYVRGNKLVQETSKMLRGS